MPVRARFRYEIARDIAGNPRLVCCRFIEPTRHIKYIRRGISFLRGDAEIILLFDFTHITATRAREADVEKKKKEKKNISDAHSVLSDIRGLHDAN